MHFTRFYQQCKSTLETHMTADGSLRNSSLLEKRIKQKYPTRAPRENLRSCRIQKAKNPFQSKALPCGTPKTPSIKEIAVHLCYGERMSQLQSSNPWSKPSAVWTACTEVHRWVLRIVLAAAVRSLQPCAGCFLSFPNTQSRPLSSGPCFHSFS